MAEKRKCKLCDESIYVNGRVVWDAVPVNLINPDGTIQATGNRSHYETCVKRRTGIN